MTCSGNEFALTPDGLAGGRVLTTDDVVRALHDTVPPTIMDFGSGTDALPGAHLFQPQNGESPGDFAAQIARQASEIHVDPPLLVMGDGPTGCISYTVAQQLVSAGYTHVGWYRGGEEGWFKASQAGSGDLLRAAK
jgi:hypothetical protein